MQSISYLQTLTANIRSLVFGLWSPENDHWPFQVDEHIWFFAKLKGAEAGWEAEADNMLAQLKLDEKKNDVRNSTFGIPDLCLFRLMQT